MTDYPLMGLVRVMVTRLLTFCSNHFFEVGETRHFISCADWYRGVL